MFPMNHSRAAGRTAVAVAAALAALAASGLALASDETGTAAVCIKDNGGQVRVPAAGQTACGPAETAARWTVGGEITTVEAGPGLQARRDGATVHLGLNAQRSPMGGRVISVFNDFQNWSRQRIEMKVPAGAWHVIATLNASEALPVYDSRDVPLETSCRLSAGDDTDTKRVHLRALSAEHELNGASKAMEAMSLQVVHRFSTNGAVELTCEPGTSTSVVKITAREADSVVNRPLELTGADPTPATE